MITGRLGLLITAYLVLTNMTAAAMSFNSPVFTAIDAWDELYKNRSSRKTDSQEEKRSSGSPILWEIVSENRFSGTTYLYTIASSSSDSPSGPSSALRSSNSCEARSTPAKIDCDIPQDFSVFLYQPTDSPIAPFKDNLFMLEYSSELV